jgi:hypothetical protein
MIKKTVEQLYKEHNGRVSDRWSSYLPQYERILNEYRDKPVRLLEIGIQNGGSLELWAKYFPNAQKLVGCDINPDCVRLSYEDSRIQVVIGNANSNAAQTKILSHAQTFDVIIDDGSHRSSDIVKSFARYFPHLVNGGVFIAEDLHCSYWKEFEGGLFDPFSSVTFFKLLADVVNHEHWGIERARCGILAGFFSKYGFKMDEETLQHIHSVEFVNSMCVIRKMEVDCNTLNKRFIAGLLEEVVPSHVGRMEHSLSQPQNQSGNEWSARSLPPDEEISSLSQAVASLMRQQSVLNAELLRLNAERSTFGARIGRGITTSLARIAPAGTRRHIAAKLVEKFVATLVVSGLKAAMAKVYRLMYARLPLKFFPKDDHQVQLKAYIERFEPSAEQLAARSVEVSAFRYMPLISVIVPIYRVPQYVLDETLASLERQTYPNWEACIVWSDIDDSIGWDWLQARTENDLRFKLKRLSENGGIARNSDAALELADGEFIALLDHDDTLSPWAFLEIVKCLQAAPELDFIYSDKDSITADGKVRLNALFKPEWSPEMLHSVNYLTHLNVIRTKLVREIGGWRPETDGAQDWDLFFRVTERTRHIARVPSILYHWRILPTSTATGLQAKPYAALAQLKSQQDYFMRRGLTASVVPTPDGMFKVCWPVNAASIDMVVFQSGTLSQLLTVLDALRRGTRKMIRRIHVVHSTPADDSLNSYRNLWRWGDIVFTQIETVNWRSALEVGLSHDDAETIVLLDGAAAGISETLPEELSGWVAHHPDIAWASALALNFDTTVYEAGRVVSDNGQSAPMFSGTPLYSFGWFGGPLWYRNARACSPYAVALNGSDARNALSQLDVLAGDRNGFADFCLALAGDDRRGLIDPFAKVYFKESPEEHWPNDGNLFHSDPYFNPAFSQVSPLRLQS